MENLSRLQGRMEQSVFGASLRNEMRLAIASLIFTRQLLIFLFHQIPQYRMENASIAVVIHFHIGVQQRSGIECHN